jgi:hypothetical protein
MKKLVLERQTAGCHAVNNCGEVWPITEMFISYFNVEINVIGIYYRKTPILRPGYT